MPRYPGDSGVFMKCGFLEMVRFDARGKHSFKFFNSFCSVSEKERGRRKQISDMWKQRIPQRKGKRCSYWVIAFDFIKVIHEVYKKQTYQGVRKVCSSFI